MEEIISSLFSKEDFANLGKQELAEVFCRNCGASVKINANYAKHIDAVDSCLGCRR